MSSFIRGRKASLYKRIFIKHTTAVKHIYTKTVIPHNIEQTSLRYHIMTIGKSVVNKHIKISNRSFQGRMKQYRECWSTTQLKPVMLQSNYGICISTLFQFISFPLELPTSSTL